MRALIISEERHMTDQKLKEWIERISEEDFGKPFRHEAHFNSRLRTTGGRYMLSDHRIEINPKYLEKFGEEEVLGIIRHELCHYHLHLEGKGYKHQDADFKQLLKKVGAPRYCQPISGHTRKRRTKIHLYGCVNCHQIYHRKIRMNTEKYRCGKCSGRLNYYGEKIV